MSKRVLANLNIIDNSILDLVENSFFGKKVLHFNHQLIF